MFFLVKFKVPSENIPLLLSSYEVELAAWIPIKQLYEIISFKDGYLNETYPKEFCGLISNKMLFPPYKNKYGEGIGRAHAFCIKYMQNKRILI